MAVWSAPTSRSQNSSATFQNLSRHNLRTTKPEQNITSLRNHYHSITITAMKAAVDQGMSCHQLWSHNQR